MFSPFSTPPTPSPCVPKPESGNLHVCVVRLFRETRWICSISLHLFRAQNFIWELHATGSRLNRNGRERRLELHIVRQHVWIREEAVTQFKEDVSGKTYIQKLEQGIMLKLHGCAAVEG
ncbi:hypothetical protein BDU57DRAFT_515808 [Ampelomyces quisqualis]|uniref:Uncharacterized protein n=1 Tax=Ampelomyces quisqualis TaxID=50730 RepID=A0A6A5QKT7_AMPQU|nr:hypothetical protein BDU57DRAFT_515808 [Ampelomyces quisqualis]